MDRAGKAIELARFRHAHPLAVAQRGNIFIREGFDPSGLSRPSRVRRTGDAVAVPGLEVADRIAAAGEPVVVVVVVDGSVAEPVPPTPGFYALQSEELDERKHNGPFRMPVT